MSARFQSQILLQLSRLARWCSGLATSYSSKRKGLHRSVRLRSNSCTPTTRFQKFRGTEYRVLGASVDDGSNVELSLTPSLCEDVFWRLPHPVYPSLSARARLRVSRSADHFEADRQLPPEVHFAPNKEQNKRTDNRHDKPAG